MPRFIQTLSLLLYFGFHHLSAQELHLQSQPFCGNLPPGFLQSLSDKRYLQEVDDFHKQWAQKAQQIEGRSLPPLYTFPVVVHIIHAGNALGTPANPTDATIRTILQEANDRFRHRSGRKFTNPNSGFDAEIEFCLAQRDPAGNTTTGIVRYNDPAKSVLTINTATAALDPLRWDINKYCNIFILADLSDACGVSYGSYTVYDAPCFWSGLIAHEMGHYFSLSHTFEGACTNNKHSLLIRKGHFFHAFGTFF
jgi:hypothetical protein